MSILIQNGPILSKVFKGLIFSINATLVIKFIMNYVSVGTLSSSTCFMYYSGLKFSWQKYSQNELQSNFVQVNNNFLLA